MPIARGVDVSAYQTVNSWSSVNAAVSFVIVKATEGNHTTSATWTKYFKASRAAGILTGSYHFAHPESGDAKSEAAHYADTLKAAGFNPGKDLPPVLDLEATGGLGKAALTAWARDFMAEVDRRLGLSGSQKCGLYCNADYYKNRTDGAALVSGRWLWLAAWPAKYANTWPPLSAMASYADMWQFSETATVSGIAGKVDGNVCDEALLRRLAPEHYGGSMRSVAQAIAEAKSEHSKPSQSWYQLCLAFVRHCWAMPGTGTPSAIVGWNRSKLKHSTGTPPKGAPVYWRGGTYGHVALSDGNGYVWSNDYRRRGKIDRVKISDITRGWGFTYLGWTGDYIGTTLPLSGGGSAPKAPSLPANAKYVPFPGAAWFKASPNHAIVKAMGQRLVAVGCGKYSVGPSNKWGKADNNSYAAWQRKLGYSGTGADGWPGKDSWDRLQVPNPNYDEEKYGMPTVGEIAAAVMHAGVKIPADYAKKYGYTRANRTYKLFELVTDAAWHSRHNSRELATIRKEVVNLRSAVSAAMGDLSEETRAAVAEALAQSVIDVNVTVRDDVK